MPSQKAISQSDAQSNPEQASEVIRVPFHGTFIQAIRNDRGVWVVLKPVCEDMELDDEGQRKRLLRTHWATTSIMEAVAEDGKYRSMFCLHEDSFPMWLATIDASRVSSEARRGVMLFQKEAAKVLRDYFYAGAAVNPRKEPEDIRRAVEEQILQAQLVKAQAEARAAEELCRARYLETPLSLLRKMPACVSQEWIKRESENLYAKAAGKDGFEEDLQLDVSTFLEGKGHSEKEIRSLRVRLGVIMAERYRERYNAEPPKCMRRIDGQNRPVGFYTAKDRDLLEQSYQELISRAA